MRYLILLAAALPLWAADDANKILQRLVDADAKNWEQARQYAFTETSTNFGYDKQGQLVQNGAAVHEVMFVEGLEYKKLVSVDGKPLDAKAQAKEDKKMQETAEERRKQRRAGPVFHRTFATGSYEELLQLFDNRLLGEEDYRGRKAWIIESTPQAGHVPKDKHEKEVMSWSHKLWIDEREGVVGRMVLTVIGDHLAMKPGTAVTFEFEKINDDAWLMVHTTWDFHLQFAKFIKPSGRSEYRYSNFKKFNVQSTITMDPPK